MQENSNQLTPRENFLISMLNKLVLEYKTILNYVRSTKPFKITEIINLSSVPGETLFLIQIKNNSCPLRLTAGQIINDNYDLNNFNEFHAEIIKKAGEGKLIEYLKLAPIQKSKYTIISKKFNKELQQNIFVIEDDKKIKFARTAEEIVKDKQLFNHLSFEDIYNIGYTQGTESIIREKIALLLNK